MSRIIRHFNHLCAAIVLCSGAVLANTLPAPVTTCDNIPRALPTDFATVQDYLNLGSSTCSIGPLVIGGFSFSAFSGAAGTPLASTTDLQIIPLWDEINTATFRIIGFTPFNVSSSQTATYRFKFAIDPAPILEGEDVSLDPPFGIINGAQILCGGSTIYTPPPTTGPPPAPQCSNPDVPLQLLTFDILNPLSIRFDPPIAILGTDTQLVLNPNQDTASGLDALVYNFYVVPEPGTWVLAASSLAALALLRRRRRR